MSFLLLIGSGRVDGSLAASLASSRFPVCELSKNFGFRAGNLISDKRLFAFQSPTVIAVREPVGVDNLSGTMEGRSGMAGKVSRVHDEEGQLCIDETQGGAGAEWCANILLCVEQRECVSIWAIHF